MRIDRIAFLELTLVLSLAGCDRPAAAPGAGTAAEPVVIPLQPPPPPVASASARPSGPVAPVASSAPADDGGCNATGSLAACDRVGPACEGLADECHSIGDEFRPRVAEGFAECFAKARLPKCRDKALGACMRKAVESACVEPFAEKLCRERMASCSAAKKPAKYTLEICTKVVSSIVGGPGSPAWGNANMEMLGPTAARSSCSLEYVLPYQPWGASWR